MIKTTSSESKTTSSSGSTWPSPLSAWASISMNSSRTTTSREFHKAWSGGLPFRSCKPWSTRRITRSSTAIWSQRIFYSSSKTRVELKWSIMEAPAFWGRGFILIFNHGFIVHQRLFWVYRILQQLICGALGASWLSSTLASHCFLGRMRSISWHISWKYAESHQPKFLSCHRGGICSSRMTTSL